MRNGREDPYDNLASGGRFKTWTPPMEQEIQILLGALHKLVPEREKLLELIRAEMRTLEQAAG